MLPRCCILSFPGAKAIVAKLIVAYIKNDSQCLSNADISRYGLSPSFGVKVQGRYFHGQKKVYCKLSIVQNLFFDFFFLKYHNSEIFKILFRKMQEM